MTKIAPPTGTGIETGSRYAVVPRSIYDDHQLTDAAVRLYCVLDGRVTVKASQQIRQDTLAEQLGWSVRKVQRALGELSAAGYITTKATARSSRLSVNNPARLSRGTRPARRGTAGNREPDTTNLAEQTECYDKSGGADTTDLAELYINTSLRNTYMTAQPPPEAASVPIIGETKPDWVTDRSGSPDPKAKSMHAADGPEIMPDRVLMDYLTAIWQKTGHHLDRNHLTEGVLTRIYQQGGNPQDTARAAAHQLAAKADRVRNPAGYLVRVVLPGIADQTLTAPPAPKPTPTPPPVADVNTAARCDHGAELGRCALCRQEKPAPRTSCVHGQYGPCTPCKVAKEQHLESFHRLVLEDHQDQPLDHGCGHPERRPDGKCLRCVAEIAAAKKAAGLAVTAA